MADVRILFFRPTLIHFFGRKKLTKKFLSWPKMVPIFYRTSYSMQCLNIYNYIRFYVVFLTPPFKKAIRDGKVVFYSPGPRDTVCVRIFFIFWWALLDGWVALDIKRRTPKKKLRSSFSAVIKGGKRKGKEEFGLVVSSSSSSSSFSSCRVDTLMRWWTLFLLPSAGPSPFPSSSGGSSSVPPCGGGVHHPLSVSEKNKIKKSLERRA